MIIKNILQNEHFFKNSPQYINVGRKRYYVLILLCSLLSSCDFLSNARDLKNDNGSTNNDTRVSSHSYEEISDRKIYWSEVFKQQELGYFVYFYSLSCSHCEAFKDNIIGYSLSSEEKMYFVESSPEVVIDENLSKNVEVDSLDQLGIKGYPTLLRIEEKKVIYNVAGIPLIKDALEMK